MRKHGGTPSWRDKHVTLAAISPHGVARGRFVVGQQTGLAGCKSPPLFKCGASSCSSQRQRQPEPWGASPRPSAPTYLPLLSVCGFTCACCLSPAAALSAVCVLVCFPVVGRLAVALCSPVLCPVVLCCCVVLCCRVLVPFCRVVCACGPFFFPFKTTAKPVSNFFLLKQNKIIHYQTHSRATRPCTLC